MFIVPVFAIAKIGQQPGLRRILLKVINPSQKQCFFSITAYLRIHISGYHMDLVSELPPWPAIF